MAYQHAYKKPIEKDIRGDISGDFGRLIIALSTGNRDEHNLDASISVNLAQSLYKAGKLKRIGEFS